MKHVFLECPDAHGHCSAQIWLKNISCDASGKFSCWPLGCHSLSTIRSKGHDCAKEAGSCSTYDGRNRQDEENKKTYIFPGHQCGNCKSKLYSETHEPPVECTIVGSETFEMAHSYRKECKEERCHVNSYRVNFAYVDSVKVNTMTFKELENLGVYMVTTGFGFTVKYLQLSYYRLLRGNLAPCQEAVCATHAFL